MPDVSRPLIAALLALLLAGTPAGAQTPGYKVIVNTANPMTKMSRQDVAALFLKKKDSWASGTVAEPVDLAEDASTRSAFSKKVLGKSTAAVKAYWNQMVFSGRNVPPPEKASEDAVVAFVRSNPGAIGYVSDGVTLRDVKVIIVE